MLSQSRYWKARVKRASARAVLAILIACTGAHAQTRVFTTGTPSELDRASTIGLEHLTLWARQRGISDELKVTRASVDRLSMAHVRVQQFYRGIPVFGGEAIAHLTATGEPSGQTDALVPHVKVDTMPQLVAAVAIARAVADSRCSDCTPQTAVDLWVVRRDGVDYLTYRVPLRPVGAATSPMLPVVFVDAHSGDVVLRYDNLQTAPH